MALDDYVNNSESISWNYNSPAVAKVYHDHLEELEQIELKKPKSYHAILRKFFSGCVYVSLFFSASQSKYFSVEMLPAPPLAQPRNQRRTIRTSQRLSRTK